jgi:hypothetical protein
MRCPNGHDFRTVPPFPNGSCRACNYASKARYRQQHPERYLASWQRQNWKQKHIRCTPEDYQKLLAYQKGRCAICRKMSRKRRLAVDHNRRTGKTRGLLCLACNTRLVKVVEDMWKLIPKAVQYLKGQN